MRSPAYAFYACGDHAFTIDYGQQIDVNINCFVIRLFQELKKNRKAYVRDIIPAYSSVTVVYDVLYFSKNSIEAASTILNYFIDGIQLAERPATVSAVDIVRIPVCYHPSLAPDMEAVCKQHGLNIETLITLHTQRTYRVFMNGFLPGFAYMGTVDDSIATARHASPRKQVPAGSVGIAGHQTGVYPFESPGGWQLIGRTPVSLFNPHTENPCLLNPGDEVQFYSIPIEDYPS